jgi:hypothetical protein
MGGQMGCDALGVWIGRKDTTKVFAFSLLGSFHHTWLVGIRGLDLEPFGPSVWISNDSLSHGVPVQDYGSTGGGYTFEVGVYVIYQGARCPCTQRVPGSFASKIVSYLVILELLCYI